MSLGSQASAPAAGQPTERVFQRAYPGKPGQVRQVRADVASAFGWCPMAGELVLVASELATNAIRHSGSGGGGEFTVTVRVRPGDFAWIGVQDQGGSRADERDARDAGGSLGKGLLIVGALAGEGNWGLLPVAGAIPPDGGVSSRGAAPGHLAWARLAWLPARG